jgi:hypothetical protein
VSPTPKADQLRELLRVSRLLRQYVEAPGAGDQAGLFIAAADALERRARRMAHLSDVPAARVDVHC